MAICSVWQMARGRQNLTPCHGKWGDGRSSHAEQQPSFSLRRQGIVCPTGGSAGYPHQSHSQPRIKTLLYLLFCIPFQRLHHPRSTSFISKTCSVRKQKVSGEDDVLGFHLGTWLVNRRSFGNFSSKWTDDLNRMHAAQNSKCALMRREWFGSPSPSPRTRRSRATDRISETGMLRLESQPRVMSPLFQLVADIYFSLW